MKAVSPVVCRVCPRGWYITGFLYLFQPKRNRKCCSGDEPQGFAYVIVQRFILGFVAPSTVCCCFGAGDGCPPGAPPGGRGGDGGRGLQLGVAVAHVHHRADPLHLRHRGRWRLLRRRLRSLLWHGGLKVRHSEIIVSVTLQGRFGFTADIVLLL